MFVGRCCACEKVGVHTAHMVRFARITSFLGNALGTEDYYWDSLYNVYGSGDSGELRNFAVGVTSPTVPIGTYQIEGFRCDTHAPYTENQQFNPFGQIGTSFDTVSANGFRFMYAPHFPTTIYDDGYANVDGQPLYNGYLTEGVVRSLSFRGASINDKTNYGPMTPVLPENSHLSPVQILSLIFPCARDSGSFSQPTIVSHYRVLADGVPISDILPAIDDENCYTVQTLSPATDVITTDWTGVGVSSPLATNLTNINDTEYIYSVAATGTVNYECTFDTALRTGEEGKWTLSCRVFKCDSSGILATGGNVLNAKIQLRCGSKLIKESTTNLIGGGFNFTLDISYEEYAEVTDWSDLRIRVVGTISGSSTPRGMAISYAELEFTPISRSIEKGVTSTDNTKFSSIWDLTPKHRRGIKRNKRLGYDIWLKVRITSANSRFVLRAGTGAEKPVKGGAGVYYNFGTTYGSVMAEGFIGAKLTSNPKLKLNQQTYKLTLNGLSGNWIHSAFDSDGVYTVPVNAFASSGTVIVGVSPSSADILEFLTNREVPFIRLVRRTTGETTYYIPQNNADFNRRHNWLTGNAAGTIYVYDQTPGGTWNCEGVDEFIPWCKAQASTTNSFSDASNIYADFPTSITIERVNAPHTITATFDEDSTWTCPSDVTTITSLTVRGAGGGSGGVDGNSGSASGGAGGGATVIKNSHTVVPDTVYTIKVGSGGVAGLIDGGNGGDGGDSWFDTSSTVMAKGGLGSIGAILDDDEQGALGGSAAASIGTTKYSGGSGADGLSTSYGGGGGSNAGTSLAGNNGSGAVGGASPQSPAGAGGNSGSAGASPGGGAGGVTGDTGAKPGNAGGNGRIQFKYVTSIPS
jgi:hypothetical protein